MITLHVWRVPQTALPQALWRMATDRQRLRRTRGVEFAKLLGTGRDLRFGPGAADPTRWAAVIAWNDPDAAGRFDDSAVGRAWGALATARCRVALRAVRSRGVWAGRAPFDVDRPSGPDGVDRPSGPDGVDRPSGPDGVDRPSGPDGVDRPGGDAARPDGDAPGPGGHADGPVLVLTRARLRPTRAVTFWRAIPAVEATLAGAPGLLAAFGIGEAPLGWQGTVSVWRAATDVTGFAYGRTEHRAVVTATPVRRWYAEELFARFTVLHVDGDRDVLGWKEGEDYPR
nr:monooxygenase [Planosporangium thailandense]